MLISLARHSFAAILLAVIVEEMGIPMPIPTDLLIIFAGAGVGGLTPRLGLYLLLLALASGVGGTGLYAIVRRGGRPLVDRFGRYVHLSPARISRAEALLSRGGWGAIAVGRAIPGLGYATVVSCGLFRVPYPRFITAHLAGSSVYIAAFLVAGAVFGPEILDRIHIPALGVRLLWLLLLALGLPALIVFWGSRVRGPSTSPSRRRALGAISLAGFLGTVALAATWSATATVSHLLGTRHPLTVTYTLLNWLLGLGLNADATAVLLFAALLALFAGTGIAFYGLVLPKFTPHRVPLPAQVAGLSLLALGLFVGIFVPALLMTESPELWWRNGGSGALPGLVLGVGIYAVTTAYGRTAALDIAARRKVT